MNAINITPMVDVMLVLLIVFMVAAPMMTTGVPVHLPNSGGRALNTQTEPLVITIRKDGSVFLNTKHKSINALRTILVSLARSLSKNEITRRKVFLRADSHVNYGSVMHVVSIIRSSGFHNIGLVTDQSLLRSSLKSHLSR